MSDTVPYLAPQSGERSSPRSGPGEGPAEAGAQQGNPHPLGFAESSSPRKRGEEIRARAYAAAAAVCDPEVPVLTIADLGVLRDVAVAEDGAVEVRITPTYSGCPAMDMIKLDVELALAKAGVDDARVRLVRAPAWTTDWMSEEGKAKLRAYGIAPPAGKASRRALFGDATIACPHCGSERTEKVSEFGSTACKALWRCTACREPFDYFKCI